MFNNKNDIKESYINIIREWFKNHKARVVHISENLTLISWGKPKSRGFKVQIILNENKVFIDSEELGEAVYKFSSKATIDNLARCDLDEFKMFLTAFSEDQEVFEKEAVMIDVEKWHKSMIDNGNSDKERIDYLYLLLEDIVNGCVDDFDSWRYELQLREDEINEIDKLEESELLEAGKMVNINILAHLEAFKLIQDQIEKLDSF